MIAGSVLSTLFSAYGRLVKVTGWELEHETRRVLLSGPQYKSMERLDESVRLLKDTLDSLEEAVETLHIQTKDVSGLQQTLHTRSLFDVLPERIVLQRPLRIQKVVKPLIEKDSMALAGLFSKYKKKRLILEQQSKIAKLKLETLNG